MTTINRSAPVLVTGATGYVAGHLVKKLLEEGLTVHAPVRDPNNPEKLKYLNAIADSSPGKIKYFKADLLAEGSYADAIEGCELVFHTASPFAVKVKDPQTQLVDPAKLGTRNVLEAANNTSSVKRIVLTSSVAAIFGDNSDVENTPNGVFDESVWNTTSSLEHNPYSYSKTVAEQEAWDLHALQSQWDLVVINPSLVIGPGINPHATSESFKILKRMGDGTMKAGAPRWGIGVVDVRDLADAHYAAGFTPEAEGRHIISAYNTDFCEMAETLIPKFGKDYPLPRRALPKALLSLVGPIADKAMSRKIIKHNVGVPIKLDNRKAIKAFGLQYRPLSESMNEFFQQMVDSGALRKK